MEKASWKPIQVWADNPATLKETLNISMTAKQPPSYDGRVSWFRYEELVDDWVTFTTIDEFKRGPRLKSYFYRLLVFFNHRRQNTEFLIFTSKFEILFSC